MGVWTIGAHYPHLFAGLLVISGRGDYYAWQRLPPEDLPAYKRRLVDAEFGYSLLPNLSKIPVMCIHGTADTVIPIEEARHMIEALRKVNSAVRFVEIEGGDHWIYEETFRRKDLRNWLRSCRRTTPVEFEYVTWLPRYSEFYWLRTDGFNHTEFPARVVVRHSKNAVEILAQGLKGVWVDPRRIPAEIRGARIIGLNGIRIRCDGTRPSLPRSGPVKDAFLQPFLFVQSGASSDTATAMTFRQAVFDWYSFSQSPPRIAHETTLSTNDLKTYNVFIFGEPESSRLATEVLARSPLKVTREAFLVGSRSFPREGHGLYLVRPSPWNPSRLAVVQCGVPWGKGLPSNHKYDFLPDFIVYGSTFDPDGSNAALCAGFFDENWELNDALVSEPRNSERSLRSLSAYW